MKLTAEQVAEALRDLDVAEREECLRLMGSMLRERGIALETSTDKLMSASALHDKVAELEALAHYHDDTEGEPPVEQWQSRLHEVERDATRLYRIVGSHAEDIDQIHHHLTNYERGKGHG